MQDKHEAVDTGYDDAVVFAQGGDDDTMVPHDNSVAGVQIIHFDEFDQPVRIETVPLADYLQKYA